MNKIKYFVMAFVAVCLTAGFYSCSNDDDPEIIEKIVE